MTEIWNAQEFLDLLQQSVGQQGNQLALSLGWKVDPRETPKVQFPGGGERPEFGPRPALFELAGPVDPDTVTPATVFVRDGATGQLLAAEVKLVDEQTISVRPLSGWRNQRYDFLLTPGIRMADGRRFSGVAQPATPV